MRKLLGSLLLSLGLGVGTANAEVAKLYFGGGFSDGSVELPGDDKSIGTANVTVGIQLLDFIGLEFEAGVASDQVGSMLSEPQVNYAAGLLRLGYRWDRFGVYALAGQAQLDIDEDLDGSDDGASNAVGFGVNLFGNETTSLNLHALRIGDGKFTTATIGFQYYFGGFR